jgi:hypothetical protein
MISTEVILNNIKEQLKSSTTKHYAILDTDIIGEPPQINEEDLHKNLAWYEPEDGIYIINLDILLHFKNYLNNIEILFRRIIDSGYIIISNRYDVPTITRFIEPITKIDNRDYLAMVVMFSSKGDVQQCIKYILNIDIPTNIDINLIFGDNTGSQEIYKIVETNKETILEKFKRIEIVNLGEPYTIGENEHYLEIDKHAHVARIYSQFLRDTVEYYDYIIKMEDDMEPPGHGLVQLYNHMKTFERKKRKVATVAGCYPQKFDPSTICVSLQPEIWGKVPKVKDILPRLFRVEMQGGGFALYKAKALKEVLPYRLVFKYPHGNYYMTGWDGYIGEEWSNLGWEQYCDGALMCKHHF